MAEEVAKGEVPAAVRHLLQERARQGVAPPATAAPVAAAEPEVFGTAEQRSLAELKEAFQKDMYLFLMQPWVEKALRRILEGKDTKAARDLFTAMLQALVPQEKPGGGGPARVTLISRIERPDGGANTTAAKIETPR